ncbi:hypothetical protein [Streptomyces goshikiensis]|uniref:hypothetical protein n=1 Tax=Streptomyces goshikiensis TaxID=1942 RepID=UPI0036C67E41
MAEIPGARTGLLRDAEEVRAYLRSLAARLTPGQVPEFALPDEPFGDWGTEPATFQYSFHGHVRARDARPERAAYDPALASRAAESLREDGWESRVETAKYPRAGGREVVVVGVRDGRRITLSFPRDHGAVLYRGQSRALPLYEHVPHVRPEPAVTPETLEPGWALCYECEGLGYCPACEGRGWVMGGRPGWGGGTSDPDRLGRCPECFTERVCPICRGRGSLRPG